MGEADAAMVGQAIAGNFVEALKTYRENCVLVAVCRLRTPDISCAAPCLEGKLLSYSIVSRKEKPAAAARALRKWAAERLIRNV